MTKPRYKLVPVTSLREGDVAWSENYAHDSTISALEEEIILKNPDVHWSGKRYAWKKQTALQKETSSLPFTGGSDPGTGDYGSYLYLSDLIHNAGCGGGIGGAVPREGNVGSSLQYQGVPEPRATVCMTLGRDIKPGQRVSFIVVQDSPAGLYYSVGGVNHMINPNMYYMVVN